MKDFREEWINLLCWKSHINTSLIFLTFNGFDWFSWKVQRSMVCLWFNTKTYKRLRSYIWRKVFKPVRAKIQNDFFIKHLHSFEEEKVSHLSHYVWQDVWNSLIDTYSKAFQLRKNLFLKHFWKRNLCSPWRPLSCFFKFINFAWQAYWYTLTLV